MKIKAKYWLAPVLLGAILTSCEKNELEELEPTSIAGTESTISNATSASVFFERLFEDSNPLSGLNMEVGPSHGMQVSSEKVYQGGKSLRVELRESDAEVAGGTRSELNLDLARNKEQWYSFAVYFPAEYNGPDSDSEVINQWHSMPDFHLGEPWRGPSKSLQIRDGRLLMKIGYNSKQVSTGYEGEKEYDLGPLPTNSWQQFTFRMIHSYGSDGLVQLWLNGRMVIEHRGGNSFNDVKLPYWKVGVYKWGWNGANKSDVSKRVLFYDNIRQGGPGATLQEMMGNETNTQLQPEPAAPSATGKIMREFWANVPGLRVSDIPLNTQPTSVSELTMFEAPSNAAEHYGARIRGYITAPTTGNYTFWISGDDYSELWLSTSEDPARKVKVAYVNGYTAPRDWNKYSSQKSVSIRLEAGKRYYIEALHKENFGGDNLAVGWQLPNGSQELPVPGNRLSTYTR